jgi:hypothetical protein
VKLLRLSIEIIRLFGENHDFNATMYTLPKWRSTMNQASNNQADETTRDKPQAKKGKKTILIIIGIISLLCICSIIGAGINNNESEGESVASIRSEATKAIRPTNTPLPTPTPKVINEELDFFVIRTNAKEMTEAQWKNYVPTVIGQRILWQGWVTEVDENGKMNIDMDPPGSLSLYDVSLRIPKEDALKYNKDQPITFEGDIKSASYNSLFGMSINLTDTAIFE